MIGDYPIFDSSSRLAIYQQNLVRFHEDIEECMAREGFEYYNPQHDQGEIWPREYLSDLVDGMSDEAFASKYGFGVMPVHAMPTDAVIMPDPDSPDFDPEADAEFNQELSARLEAYPDEDTPEGAAYWRAIDGHDGQSGCQGEASRRWLRGNATIISSQFEIEERQDRFMLDSRVLSHYSSWRLCMEEDGFGGHATPLAAYRYWTDRLSTLEVILAEDTRAEIAMAEASLRCDGPVRDLLPSELVDVWNEYSDPDWTST